MSERPELRLCFVGDSFVVGTGDPSGQGWVGRACEALRAQGVALTAYGLGVRGDTSDTLVRRAPAEVAVRLGPARAENGVWRGGVVLSFGMNDAMPTSDDAGRAVPVARSVANAEALLDALAPLAPVLVVGPPPLLEARWNSGLSDLSAALGSLCDARGVPWLAIHGALRDTPAWRDELAAGDRMHPAAGGYAALARLVLGSDPWRRWLASL